MKKNLIIPVGIGFVLIFTLFFSGCKNQKKIAQDKNGRIENEYNIKIAEAKRDLLAIINDEGSMTLEEKQNRFTAIKNENFQDREIQDLLLRAEEVIDKLIAERNAEIQKQSEEKKLETIRRNIRDGFYSVANAKTFAEANMHINRILQQFASDDVPILIIISQENGIKDYDRPTTIKKFLEYLKDVRKFDKNIESFKLGENEKIIEIELIKN